MISWAERLFNSFMITTLLAGCSLGQTKSGHKEYRLVDGESISAPLPSVTPTPIEPTRPDLLLDSAITQTAIPHAIIRIGLGGDVMLGRSVYLYSKDTGDYDVFDGIEGVVGQNDFNLINLESPLGKDCSKQGPDMGMTFCTDAMFLPYLKASNMIVGLANNHENDVVGPQGDGWKFSKEILDQYGIDSVHSNATDDEALLVKEVNGVSIGILSFNLVGPNVGSNDLGGNLYAQMNSVASIVESSADRADWLFVQLHWGSEYHREPDPWQVQFGHKLIDLGANVIVGSHPHVDMTPLCEEYGGGYIIYSLGNLVFDQNFANYPYTSISNWINLTMDQESILEVNTYSIRIRPPSFQPVLEESNN